jgi:endoplasmic reticulum-Golgi intermediate compartment protein 2
VNHAFAVEKGVSHQLQLNVDLVVRMSCGDLHINVQDAAGDRILAAEMLKREPTDWTTWVGKKNKKSHSLGSTVGDEEEVYGPGTDEDVHDYLGLARKGGKKFKKTPRVRGGVGDSCRIFGSLEGNKVQGDFHITARGHGYMEFGMHLDHTRKFVRVIQMLSKTELTGM